MMQVLYVSRTPPSKNKAERDAAIAAGAVRKQLEDAQAELAAARDAAEADAKRVAELEAAKAALEEELERLKAEQEEERKAASEMAQEVERRQEQVAQLELVCLKAQQASKELGQELESAQALAAHPLHQLFELKPFVGMSVEEGSGGFLGLGSTGPTVQSFDDGLTGPKRCLGVDEDDGSTDSAGKDLLGLYDKIGHTKKIGIAYASNVVTEVTAGLAAEQQGVEPKWKISEVQCMV